MADLPDADGISLKTRYTLKARHLVEVLHVSKILFRPPLVRPPPFHRDDDLVEYYVLNDDMYYDF